MLYNFIFLPADFTFWTWFFKLSFFKNGNVFPNWGINPNNSSHFLEGFHLQQEPNFHFILGVFHTLTLFWKCFFFLHSNVGVGEGVTFFELTWPCICCIAAPLPCPSIVRGESIPCCLYTHTFLLGWLHMICLSLSSLTNMEKRSTCVKNKQCCKILGKNNFNKKCNLCTSWLQKRRCGLYFHSQ